MIEKEKISNYYEQIENDLRNNILEFWLSNTVDNENAGFLGGIANDLKVNKEAPKGSVLCARILWTFSAAYGRYKDDSYLKVAQRAYDYLTKQFWDDDYKGIYWMLDYQGNVVSSRKQIYAQAFAIYGLSEYYRVTGTRASLDRAIEIFHLIEYKRVEPRR